VEPRIIRPKALPKPATGAGITASPAAAAPTSAVAREVRHIVVDAESAGQRLDNLLLRLLKGVPKTHVYRIIRSGEVRVNKGRAAADTRVAAGDELRLPPLRTAEAPPGAAAAPAREFPVLLEDDHLLAIDKPAGVAVHGGSGVSFGVIEQLRKARPTARFLELVHRLDRETSGVLLLAKKRSALLAMQDQFRAHAGDKLIVKVYAALVVGDWPASQKVIDVPLHKFVGADGERRVRVTSPADEDGRRSITLVKVARRFAGFTLLDVTIKTGRTHQIRVHLAHAGHPIVGDTKYGDFALNHALARGAAAAAVSTSAAGPKVRIERMFLHAQRLQFVHPATGLTVDLMAPLPVECQNALAALQART
jgi:23S rRNA pseudouridine955/2504/2580 synthase